MQNRQKEKIEKRKRRHKRQRVKIKGTKSRPRLSVFRSNKHIFCQLINDEEGKTLISASDFELKKSKSNKTEKAFAVGELLAKEAIKKEIKEVVFDKGCYKYHGRLKSVAEGARKSGLKF